MSDNNTANDEVLNDETKVTSKIAVTKEKAEEVLELLGGRYPPVDDISEIHLVITK